jgi:enoyl-CoA hydratase/carnithine racemase
MKESISITVDSAFSAADLHADPAWSALVTDDPVMELLLTGQATTAQEAEELFLKNNVDSITRQVLELVESDLSEEALSLHPLALLLRGHGSRAWEDSLL